MQGKAPSAWITDASRRAALSHHGFEHHPVHVIMSDQVACHHSQLTVRSPAAPPSLLSTAIGALCVQAIWMTRAHSSSSRGLAPSMNA
jgi:hypothetical protein